MGDPYRTNWKCLDLKDGIPGHWVCKLKDDLSLSRSVWRGRVCYLVSEGVNLRIIRA